MSGSGYPRIDRFLAWRDRHGLNGWHARAGVMACFAFAAAVGGELVVALIPAGAAIVFGGLGELTARQARRRTRRRSCSQRGDARRPES